MAEATRGRLQTAGTPQPSGPHFQLSGGASAMDHFVNLDALPDGLEFPENLKGRITFDPAKNRLIFHGFMCKSDFDRLTSLSNDFAYQRAIERLFQISTEAEPAQLRRFKLVLIVLVIICLILGAVFWWLLLHDPSLSLPNGSKTNSTSERFLVIPSERPAWSSTDHLREPKFSRAPRADRP